MPYLVLSIAAMTCLALVLRIAMARGTDALGVNVVFRAAAATSTVASVVLLLDGADVVGLWPQVSWRVAWASVFFFLSGLASIKSLQHGHLGLSWGVLRCSMLLPVVASITIWREIPVWPVSALLLVRVAGMISACLAIALVTGGQARRASVRVSSRQADRQTWLLWLGLAFLSQGMWEVVLRSTRDLPDDRARTLFVAGTFLGAALLSAGSVCVLDVRIRRRELGFGLAAGVLGALASGSRVWALRDLDGLVVFPVTTVTVMIAVHLLGGVIWREKTGLLSTLGFVLAVLSVLLMSLRFPF